MSALASVLVLALALALASAVAVAVVVKVRETRGNFVSWVERCVGEVALKSWFELGLGLGPPKRLWRSLGFGLGFGRDFCAASFCRCK